MVLKLFLIIISFLYSCTSKDEFDQASNLINIDLNESKDGKFSDVFDDPKYTLLDFSDDKPLVNPYNIIFKDGLIFIRDNRVNGLFIFEENGKIKDVIESSGQGPGEFFQMDDFQVTDDRIYIQDTYSGRQLEFDREGELIDEIKNRYNNTSFYIGESYSLYFLSYQTDYDHFNFIRKNNFDNREELYHKIPNTLANIIRSDNRNGIKEHPDKDFLYFSLPHSTCVVFINKISGFLEETYLFDFGRYNLIDEKREMERNRLPTLIREENLVRDIGLFHPYSDKYLLYINQGLNTNHYIFLDSEFDITTQKANLQNDLDGMPYLFPWTATGDNLVFRFSSIDFYNKYLEVYKGKSVEIKKGNIHDFFQLNKNNLREEKWVLVKLKIK